MRMSNKIGFISQYMGLATNIYRAKNIIAPRARAIEPVENVH